MPRRRLWPRIAAILGVLLVGHCIYDDRPGGTTEAEREATYASQRAADPATAAGEAAWHTALDELLAVTAAPDAALQRHGLWLEARAAGSGAGPAPPSAGQHEAALRQQAALWRGAMAKRPDAGSLAKDCVYQVPYATCTVTAAGEVPGSSGALRYQAAGLYLGDYSGPDADQRFAVDEAAAVQDPMVGGMIAVFAPDEAGGWRMMLAYSGRQEAGGGQDAPVQLASPAGTLLVVHPGASRDRTAYIANAGRWRALYQASWPVALASHAPAGSCLHHGFYVGRWPWPPELLTELGETPADLATLTYDGRFDADGHAIATVHANLAVQGTELVLTAAEVTRLQPVPMLDRLFGWCHGGIG